MYVNNDIQVTIIHKEIKNALNNNLREYPIKVRDLTASNLLQRHMFLKFVKYF